MGFWYFLILFVGIALIIIGLLNKDVSRSLKIVILSFILGTLFIVASLMLLLPGSSELVNQLLQLNL